MPAEPRRASTVRTPVRGRSRDRYPANAGFTTLNMISSIGSFILGASTLFFLWNVYVTSRHGEKVTGGGYWRPSPRARNASVEWAKAPPARISAATQTASMISSSVAPARWASLVSPAFDLHYPHIKTGRAPAGP